MKIQPVRSRGQQRRAIKRLSGEEEDADDAWDADAVEDADDDSDADDYAVEKAYDKD